MIQTTFEQRVKVVAILNNLSLGEVAKNYGSSQASLSVRLKNGKMSFEDQRRLADSLHCKIVIQFVFPDGQVITGNNAKELVSWACEYVDISMAKLAEKFNQLRQTFFDRVSNGRYTDTELSLIADALGCTYENYFLLDDDTKIF